MKFIHLLTLLILVFTSCEKDDETKAIEDDPKTVTDIDGNIYHTVRIGDQLWLVENLKTTRFQNGDLINELDESNSNISSFTSYNYDQTLSKTYGYLYNQHAVQDERKICPKGWHVPTYNEWRTLIKHVEQESAKLKIEGSTHWIDGNSDATNETGFTALPGGEYTFAFKEFGYMGREGNWWVGDLDKAFNDVRINIKTYDDHSSINFVTFHEGNMYSIRCIRD